MDFLSYFALAILYKAHVGGLSWMLLLLPLLLALHAMLAIGFSFALSAITAFFRDMREVVTVFTSIAMYLMPLVYLPDWMPGALRPLIYANPLSYIIWVYQDVLFFGSFRHPYAWAIVLLMAPLGLGLGYRTFERLKPYYGNVL